MRIRNKKTGKFVKGLDEGVISHIVGMIEGEHDILGIYEYLDNTFEDNRTKWEYLTEAKKRAY